METEGLNRSDFDTRQRNRYITMSDSLYANFDYLKKLFERDNYHNAENGSYNESLLMELFEKELPNNYEVTSGFVINSIGKISSQFDLIIYDSQTPLVFNKGKIAIVPLEGVRAIIEVKTSIPGIDTNNDNSLKNIVNKLVIQNYNILSTNKRIVYGVFSFDVSVDIPQNQLQEIFKDGRYRNINFCISLNKKEFIVSFSQSNSVANQLDEIYKHKYYKFSKDLSVGYFLDNIRYSVSERNSFFIDYLFPNNGKLSAYKCDLN